MELKAGRDESRLKERHSRANVAAAGLSVAVLLAGAAVVLVGRASAGRPARVSVAAGRHSAAPLSTAPGTAAKVNAAPSTVPTLSTSMVAVPAAPAPACSMPGWRQVPNNSAPVDSFMSAVAAISADDAWAVGNIPSTAGNGAYPSKTIRPGGPLVEHWDGSSWAVAATAAASGNLNAVGADGPNDVWAVGSVIEHFDGRAWSLAPAPLPESTFKLNAVAVISRADVWAVGQQGDGQLLAENWDGRKWIAGSVPDPNPGAVETFTAIAATGADDIWAVGYVNHPAVSAGPPARSASSTTTSTAAVHPNGPFGGLIEHWNGSDWSVSTVVPGEDLNAVSADARNDAWAVGGSSDIAHWDGQGWTVVANVAGRGTGSAQLYGVTALSPSDAWAVGDTYTNRAVQLIEHWDGRAWAVVSSPDPSPSSVLTGIAADSAHQIWAVGNLGWVPGTPPQVGAIIDRLCSG